MEYEAVIGLEVHAEMQTRTKMFCGCPVVDNTLAAPNTAVCPICAGLPGSLPVVNRQAVEYGLRVACALECDVAPTSIFARKNYFYPDLPKGYQISQFEYPLAEHGRLTIDTQAGSRDIRVRRVHLEEDAGKLTHVQKDGEDYSLVDLNRAGVALLEIVSEPDMHSGEEARAYAEELRAIIRTLGVNSGDMEKGVIRFEANVSVRPAGSPELGTRVEIKNLNSYRALERSIAYQVEHQIAALNRGERIVQETLGWDETREETFSQRSKEEAHDYRYFPEPDLPPLAVDAAWVGKVKASQPELPRQRRLRFMQLGLSPEDAHNLVVEQCVADFFEACLAQPSAPAPRDTAIWILGEIFGWLNQNGKTFEGLDLSAAQFVDLLLHVERGEINVNTGKQVLAEMLSTGQPADEIIRNHGWEQVSDAAWTENLVNRILAENPSEVESYLQGKETLFNWLFGQTMRAAEGKANPAVLRKVLEDRLSDMRLRG